MIRLTQLPIWSLALAAWTVSAMGAPLVIDPLESKIHVAVHATMDSFVGDLQKFTARIDCEPNSVLPSKAEVSFDLADLKTGKKDRDEAMLKWFEYDESPKASYHLTGWRQEGGANIALGELTLHGVKQTVQSPVTIQRNDGVWDLRGTAEFDYRDFKLSKIHKALILTVNPRLKVIFHLVGKLPVAR